MDGKDLDTARSTDPKKIVPGSNRRGSILRREALERWRNQQHKTNYLPHQDTSSRPNKGEDWQDGRGVEGATSREVQSQATASSIMNARRTWRTGVAPTLAWEKNSSSTANEDKKERRRRPPELDNFAAVADERRRGGEDPSRRRGGDGWNFQRRRSLRKDKMTSLHRESSSRIKELERESVGKVEASFKKLYMPPLGPLDDPPGVIYLDGDPFEKTIDVRVLESVGKGVKATRKELFDLGTRRRSLVGEIQAQNRRISRGFPRNLAVESMHERKAQEFNAEKEKVEGKLARLLDHRRRLLEVLEASQANDDKEIDVSSIARSEEAWEAVAAATGIGDSKSGNSRRRSSLEDTKNLVKELVARESSQADLGVTASISDPSSKPLKDRMTTIGKIQADETQAQLLNQGWRELIDAVFPTANEGHRKEHVTGLGSCTTEDDDRDCKIVGRQKSPEASILGFISAATPREHLQFLIAAMDPSRANELPSVIKCFLLHYTGPAAEELDLLLGGRIASKEVTALRAQVLLQISLEALDSVYISHVPSVLMLQWLLARAPHLRALLVRGGVLRRALRRLKSAEADPGNRSMQHAALSLVVGVLFS